MPEMEAVAFIQGLWRFIQVCAVCVTAYFIADLIW